MSGHKDNSEQATKGSLIEATAFRTVKLDKGVKADYSVVHVGSANYKVIFHFKNISWNFKNEIGKYLLEDIIPWFEKQGDLEAECTEADQAYVPDSLDFMVWAAPNKMITAFRARHLADTVADKLERQFGRG